MVLILMSVDRLGSPHRRDLEAGPQSRSGKRAEVHSSAVANIGTARVESSHTSEGILRPRDPKHLPESENSPTYRVTAAGVAAGSR